MSSEAPRLPPPDGASRTPGAAPADSSLVAVLWGMTGVLVGVVLGAAGVGQNVLAQLGGGSQRSSEMVELSTRIDHLRDDLTARERELSAERQERKHAVAALMQRLEASEWNGLAASHKGELVSRLLAWEQSRSETSRRQLVDVVCGLRAQSGPARMSLATGPLTITVDMLKRGPGAEIEELMARQGVAQDLLDRARRDPSAIAMPAVTAFNVFEVQRAAQRRRLAMRDVNEAVAAIQSRMQTIKLAKVIRFADGSHYSVPHEVALAMVTRKGCQTD